MNTRIPTSWEIMLLLTLKGKVLYHIFVVEKLLVSKGRTTVNH
jgi:hypothetical protein